MAKKKILKSGKNANSASIWGQSDKDLGTQGVSKDVQRIFNQIVQDGIVSSENRPNTKKVKTNRG